MVVVEENGKIIPKIKVSENVEKITTLDLSSSTDYTIEKPTRPLQM